MSYLNIEDKNIIKEAPIVLTDEEKRAISLIEQGSNIFLTGEAGTGKSTVIKEYINRNRKKRNIIVCAPTGIAAINVGGATLHRVFDIPINFTMEDKKYNSKPSSALIDSDTIIIDEISMCRKDLFSYVIKTIEVCEEIAQDKENMEAIRCNRAPLILPKKQIILIGDFFQLPPVTKGDEWDILNDRYSINSTDDTYAFNSYLWDELNLKNIVLHEILRQHDDMDYAINLNKVRAGNIDGVRWFNDNAELSNETNSIYLCGTNREANKINDKKRDEIEGKEEKYRASKIGDVKSSDMVAEEKLSLKLGMRVMTLINDPLEGYQNGSIGEITGFGKDYVSVRLDNGKEVDVKKYSWDIYDYKVVNRKVEREVKGIYRQIPLRIAYAITIHKSQGKTFDSANISPICFSQGQLYVALSRVKSLKGLSLTRKIPESSLITSTLVKDFYNNLVEEDLSKISIDDFKDVTSGKKLEDNDVEDIRIKIEYTNGMSPETIARIHCLDIEYVNRRIDSLIKKGKIKKYI